MAEGDDRCVAGPADRARPAHHIVRAEIGDINQHQAGENFAGAPPHASSISGINTNRARQAHAASRRRSMVYREEPFLGWRDDGERKGNQRRGDRDQPRAFGTPLKHQLRALPLAPPAAARGSRHPSAIRASRASLRPLPAAPTAGRGTSPRCGRQSRPIRRDPG